MFWVSVGVVIGIYIAQEYPNIPKLRPIFKNLYDRLTNNTINNP